ncbi:MAG: hypothetical protein HY721_06865 [Planctomycetes bacterium]|nr:hypothetical protein [Planctomycetota bacterium]
MPDRTHDTAPQARFRLSGEYFFTVLSSWLLPGAGHWLLGYRVRGALLAASLLGLFWVGEALAIPAAEGGSRSKPIAVGRKVNPVFFACQVGNGFSTLLAEALWGKPGPNVLDPIDRSLPRYLNLGILFTSVSGLINLLLVLHVMDPRTWVQAARDAALRKRPASGG